jgi:hypothetical protein
MDPWTKARCHALWSCDPGDMHPWVPCWGECNANYYFRPYYWKHISIHQQIAARWGADPRSPYTSDVMQQIYQELGIAETPEYEELPTPGNEKSKPSDHFESVDCKRW